MPIWLRRFTFSKIQDHFKEKSRQIEEASSSSKKSTKLVDSTGKVNTPEFLKASEQYKKPAKYK